MIKAQQPPKQKEKYKGSRLSKYVGNTPIIPIHAWDDYYIWGKAEFMNPSGSVKDRMATHILNNAEDRGLIKPGDTLVELLEILEYHFQC